jgi:ubiquinone/menaquinone biosynthesis C-methylase UbiE
VHCSDTCLPFEDSSFDAVFASCVLHHVPPASRTSFMVEMLRPLRPHSAAIVIEHNPFNPITRHIVSRCAFDADAVLLRSREVMRLMTQAGATVAGRRYVGFSPLRSALVERAEHAVGWLPVGAQYCIWGIKNSRG